jgi:RHS repeat-associated protein
VSYGYGSSPNYELKDQPLTIVYPNSVGTVTQTWNPDGTLASVEDWNSKTTTFGYNANDDLTGETAPSTTNVTATYGYNDADQMTSDSVSNGSSLFSASYSRDDDGQVTSDSSVPSGVGSYQYNSLNQLCYGGSSNSNACGSPPAGADDFGYNSADDLTNDEGTTQQVDSADALCWTYSGSSANACSSPPTGATSFGYDNKGDRTSEVPSSGSAICYSYSQPNYLTEIQTGTGSSCSSPTTVGTYAYDGDGLRESKTVSGTTTQYTWDGTGGPASDPSLLQQDAGGTITSFIYGPGGQPVEQIASSTTTYLWHDQQGSTRLITDSAGSSGTATTITYDPFGATTGTSGSLSSPFGYDGMYLDSESGLYYDHARYYDSTTAQFLTADPDVSSSLSPYAYTGNDPVNEIDPSGLIDKSDLSQSQITQINSDCGKWQQSEICKQAAFCAEPTYGIGSDSGTACTTIAQIAINNYNTLEQAIGRSDGCTVTFNGYTESLGDAQTALSEESEAYQVAQAGIDYYNQDNSCKQQLAIGGTIAVTGVAIAAPEIAGAVTASSASEAAAGLFAAHHAAAFGTAGLIIAGNAAANTCS